MNPGINQQNGPPSCDPGQAATPAVECRLGLHFSMLVAASPRRSWQACPRPNAPAGDARWGQSPFPAAQERRLRT